MKICVVSYHVLLQSSFLTNIFITLATYDIPPPPSPSGSACTTPSLLAVRVVNYSWTHQVTNSSTKAWGAEMVPNQIFSLLQSGWARVPPFFYVLNICSFFGIDDWYVKLILQLIWLNVFPHPLLCWSNVPNFSFNSIQLGMQSLSSFLPFPKIHSFYPSKYLQKTQQIFLDWKWPPPPPIC